MKIPPVCVQIIVSIMNYQTTLMMKRRLKLIHPVISQVSVFHFVLANMVSVEAGVKSTNVTIIALTMENVILTAQMSPIVIANRGITELDAKLKKEGIFVD